MSEHMVTDSAWPKEKKCEHGDTRLVGYCKARKTNCPAPVCGVLDDDIPDCNEMGLVKVCNYCEEEIEVVE